MSVTRQQRRAAQRRNAKRRRLQMAAGTALALGTAFVSPAVQAATFTVANTSDSGSGSLRQAVLDANSNAGADTIVFSVTGTITLTTGELTITGPVSINGPGASSLTIDGNDNSGIFNIVTGEAIAVAVTIDGLTLTRARGTALRSTENLTLSNAVITGNTSTSGTPGLYQVNPSSVTPRTVTLSNVQLTNNTTTSGGDANSLLATFTNSALNFTIENCTVSGNSAASIGGLRIDAGSGTGTIRNTTISGNTGVDIGGLALAFANATLRNVTISGNTSSYYGAIFTYGGSLTLEHSTVSNNTATGDGGSMRLRNQIAEIRNSIVANGSLSGGTDFSLDRTTVTANYSLIENPPAGMLGSNNITGTDPALGPLQNNGGTTLTHLPAAASPAINAGDPAFAGTPSTDQRGFPRAHGTLDMGSVEVQPVVSFSSATHAAAENGGSVTVTVSRAQSSGGAVSVDYATSDGTAGAGSDYTAASGTLTWADGDSAAKTFSVPITDDPTEEADETINLTLSNPVGGAISGGSAVVVISDPEDTATVLSLSSATYSVGEGGGQLTVTVNRVGGTASAVSVGYATSDDTASASSDYTAVSATLSWSAGDGSAKTFTVPITNDTLYEGNETFNIVLSNPTGGATLGTSSAVATITDNDSQPAISIGDATAFEGNSGTTNLTFAVTLSNPSVQSISVAYATANGTAASGSDYTAAGDTLNFAAGETSKNVTVSVAGDTTAEVTETFTVNLTAPSNASISDGAGLGTIRADDSPYQVINTNDNGPGSLRDALASANAIAGAEEIQFTVTGTITLTSGELPVTQSVTIDGPGASSLAISGNDASRVFNIDDGNNTAFQTVVIDGLTARNAADAGNEGAIRNRENLTVSDAAIRSGSTTALATQHGSLAMTDVAIGSNTKGGLVIQQSPSVTLTRVQITDNSQSVSAVAAGLHATNVGSLQITDSTIAGNSGISDGGVTLSAVSLTGASSIRGTTISGNTGRRGGGLAILGTTDLTIESSTISGNNAYAPTLQPNDRRGGGIFLDTSTVQVKHSTVAANSAADLAGNLFLSDATLQLRNSVVADGSAPSSADVHVAQGSAPAANYSLIEAPPPGLTGANNITALDPQLGALQNNGGLTLTRRPEPGSPLVDAGDPSFASPPSTDQRGRTRVVNGRIDMGAVEIQSIVAMASPTYSIGEAGGTLTVTVNRTGGTSGAVSVNYQTSNGTAAAEADYTGTTGTLNWADGESGSKTFTVSILNDSRDEVDETFNVSLVSATGEVVIGASSAVVTIVDNDPTPTISIGDASITEGNAGTTTLSFPVTITGSSAYSVTVNYSTSDGTALAGSDYVSKSGTLTLGGEPVSVDIVINGDTAGEADETFTVTLASPSNATITDGSATGTILADDSPFLVTNTSDSGPGSLRRAIAAANTKPGADTVNITATGTITLTTGEVPVTGPVLIDGPGLASLTISGNDASRIFNIDGNDSAVHDVTVEGVTLTDGSAGSGDGGAIRSRENLTVTNAAITGSAAGRGGGVFATVGSLTMSNVNVASNTGAERAGVAVENCSSVSLSNVQLTGNQATGSAGGLGVNGADSLVIDDSTIAGNTAQNKAGVSVHDASRTTPAVIRRSTISGNNATATYGAGMAVTQSQVTLENATVSGNTATTAAGGLYLYASAVSIRHSTVTGNSAPQRGGNILLSTRDQANTLTVANSIVANGTSGDGLDIRILNEGTATGTVTANHSLVEAPPVMSGSANLTGVDPQLGPLQNNGGTTNTHLPAAGSPVVDAGDPAVTNSPATDQRGLSRVVNGRVDMGSVELRNVLSLSDAAPTVSEGAGSLTVTVNRTGSSGAVSVNYVTSSSSAQADSDFTSASGTLNWADGDTAAKTFNVPIANDSLSEGSETFIITLSAPTGEVTLGTKTATATITDNDPQPTISIAGVSQNEGNSGTTQFAFAVTLSAASGQTVTVDYATANESAGSSDYTAASGTLTFNPGETSKSISVAVTGDTTLEPDETFKVNLSAAVNATLQAGTATGTIVNDDSSPFGAPLSVSAVATSASQVSVTWAPVSGATSYRVYRATSLTSGYVLAGATSGTSFTDSGRAADTTYLYKVSAVNSAAVESALSAVDVATTTVFTDANPGTATPVKAAHISELRTAVNAMRAAANLPPATFTDATLVPRTTVAQVAHINELRAALDAARSALGLAAATYADATLTPQSTHIRALHVTDLRRGVQ